MVLIGYGFRVGLPGCIATGTSNISYIKEIATVPEPATVSLMALGMGVFQEQGEPIHKNIPVHLLTSIHI